MTYSVRAFAELAGVTVNALHYYERHGLLAPRRTRAGYRRYTIKDLARLQRIIALKSLGLPLKQITPLVCSARLKPRAPADTSAPADRKAPADGKEREALAERPSRLRARDTKASFRAAVTLTAHRDKFV